MSAAVASGHPDTTAAARAILTAGGNAFDAVVAAGFAACVAEPCLTSLGGGGFILTEADQEQRLFDFFAAVPGLGRTNDAQPIEPVDVDFDHTTQEFHVGAWSVAVPGTLFGLVHVQSTLGRLSLSDTLAPATVLARSGSVINQIGARFIHLLVPILTASATGRRLFTRHGSPLDDGDVFTNPELADVFEQLGRGTNPLDETWCGPAVTAYDIADYRVIERAPLRFDVGEVAVATNPWPSLGGRLIAEGLTHLESAKVADLDALIEAQVVMTDLRRRMGPGTARGTTHVSVADDEGNVAAMTCSNGSGSGWFAEGTGVHLNNMMGEVDLHPAGLVNALPGRRIGSMMAPTLLDFPDGHKVALGSGGSERIRSALTQVIHGLIHEGIGLQEAIDRPRVHLADGVLHVEPGDGHISDGDWTVNRWPVTDVYFGGAHAVDDRGEAAGDPRRGGSTWSSIETPGAQPASG